MTVQIDTSLVLRNLTDLWMERLPRLAEHITLTFGVVIPALSHLNRLFMAHTDGDVPTRNIGGRWSQKWLLENGILEEVALNYEYAEMYQTDSSDEVYITPSFLFCFDNTTVLLSERYGPHLTHRLIGRLSHTNAMSGFEWETVWKSASRGGPGKK